MAIDNKEKNFWLCLSQFPWFFAPDDILKIPAHYPSYRLGVRRLRGRGSGGETRTNMLRTKHLRYKNSTLIVYKELSSPIFQSSSVTESGIRDSWLFTKLCHFVPFFLSFFFGLVNFFKISAEEKSRRGSVEPFIFPLYFSISDHRFGNSEGLVAAT